MVTILANAGVPMLFLHMPAILLALLPIIAIETGIAAWKLKKPFLKAAGPIAAANGASMLLGFPLLWFLSVAALAVTGGGKAYGLDSVWKVIYAVTVQSPWLVPYQGELKWMIPVAGLVMLVPAFFLSVWSERLVLQRFWKTDTRVALQGFSWTAHGASYLVLVAMWVAYGFLTGGFRWQ